MRDYNQYERIGMTIPGLDKIATEQLVKFVASGTSGSFISYFELDEHTADAAIEAEIAYFSALGKPFEWKVYDTDAPADMGRRLVQHGFEPGEPESFMALDPSAITAPLAERDLCVEVTDEQGIGDAIAVQEIVWGRDFSGQLTHLLDLKAASPDSAAIYVVYDGSTPVSAAWIVYTDDSPFAGIWGGATVERYRGKGYYSALLHKRINDARRKGVAHLIIDASPMSRPIVEKYGFKFVATTTPYSYEPS
jgi:GNAT superfamily N-acetyltransferase